MSDSKKKAAAVKVVPPKNDCPAFRRRLVEEYHRSVVESGREPPAYHTFSDRYGGTCGVPFATRREATIKGASSSAWNFAVSVQWCIDRADALENEGKLTEANNYLQIALEQLQRGGNHPVGDTQSGAIVPEGMAEQNHSCVAGILSRLGKVAMRQSDYQKALNFFLLSSRLDPLTSATYALRASCQEHLGNYNDAYNEYKKYLFINEPSMAMLAHTGQCALKAGHYEGAEHHLRELLRFAKESNSTILSPSSKSPKFFDSPSFYESHAYYCLGLVRDRQAEESLSQASAESSPEKVHVCCSVADERMRQAREFYKLAASNVEYVNAFEEAAEGAIAAGDVPLALENLRNLQHLRSNCARYHFRAADVCAMMNDTQSELEELSKALDRRQTALERQQTLLRRASVYASKLENFNNAIVDLSLLLSMHGEHYCRAMAYLQRANAFYQRSERYPSNSHEDRAAALRDYEKFVEVSLSSPQGPSIPPESITEAMLILADGAFEERKFDVAANFFSRAVVRGWKPREPLPKSSKRRKRTTSSAVVSFAAATETDLLTKMTISIAHVVISKHPVNEEMFKVSYEAREKPVAPVAAEPKKAKTTDKKEAEKPLVAVPAVGYQMVESHFQGLRALEPTVFSSLQYEFMELWEPYRTDVERLREDLMLTRSGKKVKRR
ncbi:hypothetical protein, conserved [Trypanosoma brucei brucei TREU927]|uniref:Uncharacterized protein n=1 Tax=Trypanosoma brucei brucei (strain 927/4 GUTat10.1) TaxID=185431 RepID=Q388E7_TRYB2|nr:hypothetical protein, conserved [Trypanosoma brucei brucei TREU927]EAN78823.1 hypothetical protein, conserved [Trypanosoma brucei brucei TREU927]